MNIELIEPAQETTALTVQHRAALALNSTKTEADLKAMATKHTSIVLVIDKAGRAQAHGAAMELRTARTDIEKVSKASRDDATKFSKAVIQEENRLIAIIEPEEKRLIGLRDSWDAEQERIAKEKEALERARVLAITERITAIRGYTGLAAQCRTAARINELLDKLARVSLDDFAEFADEAVSVHASAMKQVEALLVAKHQEEQEAARVKAEQEAESKRLAEERAALEKEKAELAAQRAAVDAAKRAEFFASQKHPDGSPMYSSTTFKDNGDPIQLTPDGKRSVFCDLLDGPDGESPYTADDFDAQVQQFAQAVAPAASNPLPAAKPASIAAPAPKAIRPTDMQIVEALSLHFRVHESKVLEWLLAMDLNEVTEAISAEFM